MRLWADNPDRTLHWGVALQLRNPHVVPHQPGTSILAELAARPREITLTRAELSTSADDPDSTLDGEEEPEQPAVQEAL